MRIDCTQCEMYRTEHCDGCLVTALLHPPGSEVEIDDALGEPLDALAGAGLVPVLKFRPRPQRAPDEAPDAPETGLGRASA
jgi:hypothetical protein